MTQHTNYSNIIKLYQEGYSGNNIAKKLDITSDKVYSVLKKEKVSLRYTNNKRRKIKAFQGYDLGYVIGIIEGEGTLCLTKVKKKRATRGYMYRSHVHIVNTCFEMIEKIQEITGLGWVSKPKKPKGNKQLTKTIMFSANDQRQLLPKIYPYLISKKIQCKLLMEALELLKQNKACPFEQIDKNHLRLDEIYYEMWVLNGKSNMSKLSK